MTKYTNIKGACEHISAGKNKTLAIAEAAGAVIRIGTRFTRYDLDKIDEYMEEQRKAGKVVPFQKGAANG